MATVRESVAVEEPRAPPPSLGLDAGGVWEIARRQWPGGADWERKGGRLRTRGANLAAVAGIDDWQREARLRLEGMGRARALSRQRLARREEHRRLLQVVKTKGERAGPARLVRWSAWRDQRALAAVGSVVSLMAEWSKVLR